MSSLAFDKQGKPFAWHKRTAKLRVRLFRNPSARGTCCQVLDGVGSPLFVDADIDYTEFRRAVSGVPGLYRLDQCDEDGVEIDDAAPAYVSIEQLRNAGMVAETAQLGEVSPLLIIERLVALQSDVMKTMATQHAAILASSAEIMRAPYRPVPLLPAADLRNADADNDNADEVEDDEDETLDERSALAPMLSMLEPHLPQLGAFLYSKFVEFFRQVPPATTPPAATPTPMPAPAAATDFTSPHGAREPVDVAAGFEAEDDFEVETIELDASQVPSDAPAAIATVPAPTVAPTAEATIQPAPPPEQLAHLYAIRERLSAKERAIAENAIARMAPDMLARWLAQLSAMSVEDATSTIRTMVAQLDTPRGKERR
ncbi:MAG: hypothetical protein M3680_00460 [Myxococcota bacterium]|nr:hypothetical protein [Myxococcota bacterium]